MQLTRTTLPSVYELLDTFSEDVGLVYDSDATMTEYGGVITSVVPDIVDAGVGTSIVGDVATVSGEYTSLFPHVISWAAPQSPAHEPPVFTDSISWGNVPDPGDPAIWYLYAYRPPPEQVKTVTFTVTGTYSRQDVAEPPDPTPDPVTGIPFSLTFTQDVLYDLDTNVAEFMGYV